MTPWGSIDSAPPKSYHSAEIAEPVKFSIKRSENGAYEEPFDAERIPLNFWNKSKDDDHDGGNVSKERSKERPQDDFVHQWDTWHQRPFVGR